MRPRGVTVYSHISIIKIVYKRPPVSPHVTVLQTDDNRYAKDTTTYAHTFTLYHTQPEILQ